MVAQSGLLATVMAISKAPRGLAAFVGLWHTIGGFGLDLPQGRQRCMDAKKSPAHGYDYGASRLGMVGPKNGYKKPGQGCVGCVAPVSNYGFQPLAGPTGCLAAPEAFGGLHGKLFRIREMVDKGRRNPAPRIGRCLGPSLRKPAAQFMENAGITKDPVAVSNSTTSGSPSSGSVYRSSFCAAGIGSTPQSALFSTAFAQVPIHRLG